MKFIHVLWYLVFVPNWEPKPREMLGDPLKTMLTNSISCHDNSPWHCSSVPAKSWPRTNWKHKWSKFQSQSIPNIGLRLADHPWPLHARSQIYDGKNGSNMLKPSIGSEDVVAEVQDSGSQSTLLRSMSPLNAKTATLADGSENGTPQPRPRWRKVMKVMWSWSLRGSLRLFWVCPVQSSSSVPLKILSQVTVSAAFAWWHAKSTVATPQVPRLFLSVVFFQLDETRWFLDCPSRFWFLLETLAKKMQKHIPCLRRCLSHVRGKSVRVSFRPHVSNGKIPYCRPKPIKSTKSVTLKKENCLKQQTISPFESQIFLDPKCGSKIHQNVPRWGHTTEGLCDFAPGTPRETQRLRSWCKLLRFEWKNWGTEDFSWWCLAPFPPGFNDSKLVVCSFSCLNFGRFLILCFTVSCHLKNPPLWNGTKQLLCLSSVACHANVFRWQVARWDQCKKIAKQTHLEERQRKPLYI